ncbi:GAF domain-containing protein [Williamsia sp. MIQD14]|uniref:GAF domain-containing protein n=1 Tax=Williamsia sp. MIQD14 TaxID=3425703 RepID=UPI003DA03C22
MQVTNDSQWYLIATFRGGVSGVVARGHDPAHQENFRQLKSFMPNHLAKPFNNLVCEAIASREPVRRKDPIDDRGRKWWGIATPVLAASGAAHAVLLWIGTTPEPAGESPLVAGAWEWELEPQRISIFGPGVPEMYGRSDWVVGQRYPMSELTGLIRAMQQMPEAERVISRKVDGERLLTGMAVERGPVGGDIAEMRSAMEVVRGDDGSHHWLGFSWEVSEFLPPQRSLETEALVELAHEAPGWTMLMLRKPISLVKPLSSELTVHVDNYTGRVTVHPQDAEVPRRIEAALETGNGEGVLRLLGVDGEWETYRVRARPNIDNWAVVRFLRIPDDTPDIDELE